MQKIEVDVTPVRIVSVGTARPQNEVVITVLKYKIVIPKIEQLEDDLEYVLPNSVEIKIPDEYIGYQVFPLNEQVLSDVYEAYLNVQGDQLKQHLLEQDYEQEFILTITPNFDNVVATEVTYIAQTQNKYGVAEFSNLPTLYINQSGRLVSRADLVSTITDDKQAVSTLFDRVKTTYKGELFDSIWWKLSELGYKYAIEADYADGRTEEVWQGNRLGYWDVDGLRFDAKNLPSAIYFVFKHNDRKTRAKIFDISNQPEQQSSSGTARPAPVYNDGAIPDEE